MMRMSTRQRQQHQSAIIVQVLLRAATLLLPPALLVLLLPTSTVVVGAPSLISSSNEETTTTTTTTTTTITAAARFKAPNANTLPQLAQEWKERDAALWSYVESHVPAVLEHTGSAAFDEHLRGVQAVLRHWGAPDHLAAAGLFHSIYGTEGFQGFALPLAERPAIRSLIGSPAEKLCFVFCMVDRSTLDETVFRWDDANSNDDRRSAVFTLRARPELGRFAMELNREEWLDFVELSLADWMEQVEGAAQKPCDLYSWKTGEAYAYRRTAYRAMARLLAAERADRLATVVPAMVEAVYATEPLATRHLLQPRTPPMTQAAEAALAALRANGEFIPEDTTPQPISSASADEQQQQHQQECEA